MTVRQCYNCSSLAPRLMKRRLERSDMEPDKKRAMYEDRMSSRLYNFHIHEHPSSSGHPKIQELDLDDWGIDDSPGTICYVEEPTSSGVECSHVGGVELSFELKSFIHSMNHQNDLSKFRGSKTGTELVLYRGPLVSSASNDDIRNRISEVENWDDEVLIDQADHISNMRQVITFPEDLTSIPSSSTSANSTNTVNSDENSGRPSRIEPMKPRQYNNPIVQTACRQPHCDDDSQMDID